MTAEDELFDELRAANPYVATGDLPPATTSRDARFEEITMHTPTATPDTRSGAGAPRRFWQNPRIAAPAALAVVALVAVGALIAGTATAPSAQALVTQAARNAAEFDSGRIVMDILVDEDLGNTGDFRLDLRFEGENYDGLLTSIDGEGNPLLIDGEPELTMRKVDGILFESAPGRDGFTARTADTDDVIDAETLEVGAILPILEQATNFDEASSDGGSTTYSATVATSVIRAIPENELPPGLALLAVQGPQDTGEDLPETVDLTVVVSDELIRSMTVAVVGDTDLGFTDVRVVTTYSELGIDYGITAPDASQIIDR